MSADHPSTPLKHLWTTAREYLTHWFTAGVIVTLTGFTPDHWVANFFHAVNLDGIFEAFPAADYRLIVVGVGVIVSTFAVIFQISRMQKQQLAAFAANPAITVAAHPASSPHVNDIDDMAHKPSIAVLPFVNLSSDPEQEYFADGMTEDIITGLSCDSRLFVISRNSTFVYKGKPVDSRAVGKELGVRYVLEGSIRPATDKLRINLQLIDTANGAHVWADRIDRPKSELFDVMDEVVDDIVMALCTNLSVAESNRAKRQRPEDLQAWALCAQAEFLSMAQPSPETTLEAEKLARRAAEIEPGYALSWALLAYLASQQIAYGLSADMANDSERSLALAAKALSLAPNDPVVLSYCGIAANWAGQGALAVDYLERSLAINPNSSFARFAYGAALNNNARPEEAIAQLQSFIRRSPKDPYIGRACFYLSWCYLELGELQQMEQAAHACIKHLPGFAWGYLSLAMSLAAQGRNAEVAQQMQKVRQLAPGMTRQAVEDFWRHLRRKPEQAEIFLALARQVYGD